MVEGEGVCRFGCIGVCSCDLEIGSSIVIPLHCECGNAFLFCFSCSVLVFISVESRSSSLQMRDAIHDNQQQYINSPLLNGFFSGQFLVTQSLRVLDLAAAEFSCHVDFADAGKLLTGLDHRRYPTQHRVPWLFRCWVGLVVPHERRGWSGSATRGLVGLWQRAVSKSR